MSSASGDEPTAASQRPEPHGVASPAARRKAAGPSRYAIRMRAGLRYTLIALAAGLLALATFFAQRQAPHPDMFRPLGDWDLFKADWWAYPLERNAFKRRVVRGDLTAVFVLPNTQKLWAVGAGGLILHSDDGGINWVQQRPVKRVAEGEPQRRSAAWSLIPEAVAAEAADPKQQAAPYAAPRPAPNPPTGLVAVPYAVPNLPAPAANIKPKLESPKQQTPKTNVGTATESGAKADTQPAATAPPGPGPDIAELQSVFFVDDRLGWAVGENGTILATSDGGVSWAVQASGSKAILQSVQFTTDGRRGWAVGDSGTILATSNGGSSWSVQKSGSEAALYGVRFASDGRRGWVVGDSGTLLTTGDGGGSWVGSWVGQAIPNRQQVFGLWFTGDGQRGWAVGAQGTLLATSNGGKTWAAQSGGGEIDFVAVTFADDGQRGWAVGDGGTILATRDAGVSWSAQASGSTARLAGVQVTGDGQRAWAVGDHGTIVASMDGGASWAAQTSGGSATINDLTFSSRGEDGWAVGNGGTILTTGNGGESWAIRRTGSKARLASVQFVSGGQRGWAVGADGTILATSDAGKSWAAQAAGTEASLTGAHFSSDGLHGWAVGWFVTQDLANGSNPVVATQNGGGAWTTLSKVEPTTLLNSVHFTRDGRRGWAVGSESLGSGGIVLASTDGGASWATQARSAEWLNRVRFADDGAHGWAVGKQGTILATANGGANWAAQTSGTRWMLYDLHVTGDGQRAWTVGNDGTIFATTNGGALWSAQDSGSKALLTSVHFSGDGLRGWAAGEHGTILLTRNGGRQWSETAPYQRYWAPWYFATLALLAFTLLALLGFVESVRAGVAGDEGEAPPDGAATLLRSDQPVADKKFDRLGVRPAVEALSSFIRNRGTEPRVTIAVTGEWGNGKSSVMRMLQTELDRAGFRSAWFNAWHHQQEGRQLSALFNVVRTQAVPSWWRQPVSALRVRSRLIWGRGWFYKVVAVATALTLALLAGDMFAEGRSTALERLQLNFRHYVLQQRQTAITGASLAKLDPYVKPAANAASAASLASPPPTSTAQLNPTVAPAAPPNPCDPAQRIAHPKTEPIRPELYCYMKQHLQWEESGDAIQCGVQHDRPVDPGKRCVFDSAEDLIATLEARGASGEHKLWPSETKAILAAAETLPPPPIFPWMEHSLLGGLAGFLLLLFGKGITVYGLQLTAPLRTLLAAGAKGADNSKEASGTVERYRGEFNLLCEALGGRLVIFIDDLDRCTPETVNGMLELTNYLADVGPCFIVMGAAMDRVKRCVRSPVADDDHDAYATSYLRKLVHIELPVPQNRGLLEGLVAADTTVQPTESVRSDVRRFAWRAALVAAAAATLLLVFFAGRQLHRGGEGRALLVSEAAPPASVAGSASAAGAAASAATVKPGIDRERDTRPSDVGLVPSSPAVWPVSWLAPATLLVLAGMLWPWVRRNREKVVIALGGALRAEDSDRFMQALKIWNPVVVSYDPTPRHVKRFYNRARLFAAYEQEEGARDAALDETLVALAAMHHLDPVSLADLADALAQGERDGTAAVDCVSNWSQQDRLEAATWLRASAGAGPDAAAESVHSARATALHYAWAKHLALFASAPSAIQVSRFASRVEGILVR